MNKSNDNRYHKSNGPWPSYIQDDIKHWWLFGKIHRYYGPARVRSHDKDWVVHGTWIRTEL